jgi:predicted enzyme related to lactoylglutathione lyase
MQDASRFVWYDLMTKDPAGAQRFYGAVAGWGTQEFRSVAEMPPYTMWTIGGTPIGGVMPLPVEASAAGAPSHWLGYVGVRDTDATHAAAAKAGAKTHVAPTDIPTVGRFSVIQDPWGASLALFTPAGSGSGTPAPGPGIFSWAELTTSGSLDEALAFYQRLLGFEVLERHDMGPAGIYAILASGGVPIGGASSRPGHSAWMYYLQVADVDASTATVTAQQGQVLHGPMEVPGGDRIAVCTDPQGAAFGLHQRVAG